MFYDPLYDLDGDGRMDAGEVSCAMMMAEDCARDEQAAPRVTNGRGMTVWNLLILLWVLLEVISMFR